jgi:O-antigen/teichoic acid export membrane protein
MVGFLRSSGLLLMIAWAQRLTTFALNAVLLRHVSAATFGFAASDMELLIATIMLLSQAPRVIAIRFEKDTLQNSKGLSRQHLINISWLPTFPGWCLCAIAAAGFNASTSLHSKEKSAAIIYCLAAALEIAAEPAFIMSQSAMHTGIRSVEVFGTLARGILTYIIEINLHLGPLSFAVGQLAYAASLCIGYWVYLLTGGRGGPGSLLPKWLPRSKRTTVSESVWVLLAKAARTQLGDQQASVLAAMFISSGWKHLLTEGDRIVLLSFASQEARGVYAVVTNYGSLAARLFFQPVEESTRNYLAKLFARSDAATEHDGASSSAAAREGAQIYTAVLRVVLTVGLMFACIASNYTHELVALLLGASWSAQGVQAALAAYCWYVPLMALNGVTEGFENAVADARRVAVGSVLLGAIVVCSTVTAIGKLFVLCVAG